MLYNRRKFRSQTSDNMDRWKEEMGRVRKKRRVEERKSEKRKSQKKEDAGVRKDRKVAKHCIFPMICGSGGSKSKLAKAAGVEPSGQMRDEKLHAVVARSTFRSQNVQNTPCSDHFWKLRCRKSACRCGARHISKSKCTKHTMLGPLLEVEMSKKCTPLWRETHFEVKMYKAHHARTTFGSWDVEKVHAVVARSTFRSQNVQNTPCSDHFWKLRCRKSACRCGAKHISKSTCTKHTMLGPLLEVEMSKKCTPLWRETHFEVKMYKTHHARTTFGSRDVEKVHAVVARSTFRSQHVQNTPCSDHFWSQHVQNTPCSDHFWKLRCRKSACRCGAKHISKSKCTKHTMLGPLLEVEMSKKCTLLWREAHFEVKMYKAHHARTTFGRSDFVSRCKRKGLCTLSKMSKTWGFCSISKNDGRRGAEQDLQRCMFRGRRSTRDIFIRAVRRSGRWFPKKGCILEPQILRFALLRWFCVTGAALRMTWHHFFVAGAIIL